MKSKSIAIMPSQPLLDPKSTSKSQLQEVLNREEALWTIKSITKWIIQGEKNTKYYHALI